MNHLDEHWGFWSTMAILLGSVMFMIFLAFEARHRHEFDNLPIEATKSPCPELIRRAVEK